MVMVTLKANYSKKSARNPPTSKYFRFLFADSKEACVKRIGGAFVWLNEFPPKKKFTLEQALRAQWRSRGIAVLFL